MVRVTKGKAGKKRTSIGSGRVSKPKNKHQRRCWKKYHRQGR